MVHPATPEYKRLRLVWWFCLGGAIVLSTVAWLLWRNEDARTVGNWVLGAGYALIFVAVGIDWFKLRPMRQEWAATHGGDGATKPAEKS